MAANHLDSDQNKMLAIVSEGAMVNKKRLRRVLYRRLKAATIRSDWARAGTIRGMIRSLDSRAETPGGILIQLGAIHKKKRSTKARMPAGRRPLTTQLKGGL
jgi:hypothetical protein